MKTPRTREHALALAAWASRKVTKARTAYRQAQDMPGRTHSERRRRAIALENLGRELDELRRLEQRYRDAAERMAPLAA